MTDQSPPTDVSPTSSRAASKLCLPCSKWRLAAAAAVLVALAFFVGMLVAHNIDDDPAFGPGAVAEPRSRAVAMAAALLHREVDVNKWTPNAPFFTPAGWLDDMPAYQTGIIGAVARFTAALVEEHGAGGNDTEVVRAAGLLKYPGTIWKFDTHNSWLPTASADKQYRVAQHALESYNERVAKGSVPFDRRAEAMAIVLDGVVRDLDQAVAGIGRHMAEAKPVLLDFTVDDIFYGNKGRAYAYSVLMREVAADGSALLADRRLESGWTRMLQDLQAAAAMRPAVVLSAAPDAILLPNHLAAQGLFLLRARGSAAELAGALRK